ncbi:MAG: TonB-dependent receptor [Chloroflexota bacterium]|nr:TonB-dependent receptor [Chloroflexota bacterium]
MKSRGASSYPFGFIVESGARQDTTAIAFFAENEYHVNDDWSLIFGLRYSDEEKEIDFSETGNCGGYATFPISNISSCVFTASDSESWQTLGGKVGVRYMMNEDVQLYGHFTRGFRSGGFNARDLLADGMSPPPYDEEEMDVFEVGMKADWLDGRVRTNLAFFYNQGEDLIRDVTVPDINNIGIQTTANTADADILGVEFEGHWLIQDNLLWEFGFGYLDFDYKEVRFDINGDGVANDLDKEQKFPRLADWTVHTALNYDVQMENGDLAMRLSYDWRDHIFWADNNLVELLDINMVNARVAYRFGSGRQYEIAAYGKNLLDEYKTVLNSAIPGIFAPQDPFFGPSSIASTTLNGLGTYAVIGRGRQFGIEFSASL